LQTERRWVNIAVPRVFPQLNGFDVRVNRVEDQDEPHVHVYKAGAVQVRPKRKLVRPSESLKNISMSAGKNGKNGTRKAAISPVH
jgi:hypothetical protein